MIPRRLLLAATAALAGCASAEAPATAQPAAPAPAARPPAAAPSAPSQPFASFLRDLRAEARSAGVSDRTLNAALSDIEPVPRVLELDRRQPEFTLTFAQYRERQVTAQRRDRGRALMRENAALLRGIEQQHRVPSEIVMAIWAIETNYGTITGGFNVIAALATLAWDGRRATFFRRELLAALRILDAGHVQPGAMRGSWAGAMGHPQFMPTSFERFAVDQDGDGRRDIWGSRADALGSIANYLARSGWREGETWGREVRLPPRFDTTGTGRDATRPLSAWARAGVRAVDGGALPVSEIAAGLVLPDGASGAAFVVYRNFGVIRRYNPSDYYALSVGLIADGLRA
jgi:membrane-bound lytic murein transglycosylase B